MECKATWRRWLLAALMAVSIVSYARPPASAGSDIADAAQAIHTHAGAHRLILLGELHGTREIPELVRLLATRYAAQGPVLLALEMPHREQASLNAYLSSNGDAHARATLRARALWQRADTDHDGRRSEEMLELIEAMRVLRGQGRDVAMLAYDTAADAPRNDANARDRFMAEVVRAAHGALPRGRLLVLGGNVHAMLERPGYAPPQMPVPMGAYLRDLQPVSVRIGAAAGEFWACRQPRPCGALAVDGSPGHTGPQPMPYTFGVMLERMSVARLIGRADDAENRRAVGP
ncbi:calcium-binding protein [Lysobacter korlensis]|uniref:Calcium-binding protein n=1 Tax=Lysobacter korlensis TaxID=553636 RepID=A0ABV6RR67_9GAMM